MTKIPSVEERVEEFEHKYQDFNMCSASSTWVREALTADRTALLTELTQTIQTIDFFGWNTQMQSKIKEKVQAYINNLINPSV